MYNLVEAHIRPFYFYFAIASSARIPYHNALLKTVLLLLVRNILTDLEEYINALLAFHLGSLNFTTLQQKESGPTVLLTGNLDIL